MRRVSFIEREVAIARRRVWVALVVALAVIVLLGVSIPPALSPGLSPGAAVLAQQGTVPRKNLVAVLTSAARTTSVTTRAFAVGDADNLIAYLTVTAGSGTNPTLDVKFQDTSDNGTTWWDIAGTPFATVTGSSSSQLVAASRKFGTQVRAVITIGGTTPSFTFHLEMLAY
jgi:hypothetical protein